MICLYLKAVFLTFILFLAAGFGENDLNERFLGN
jgi:hypothetical protein